jgi:two-component system, chemotaxis family, chemotaxis protein CheY
MDTAITVLIVEDDFKMAALIEGYLRNMGFSNMQIAESGQAALDILQSQKIGLVISDLSMPEISGIDLLKKTREDLNLKILPFIMLTGSDKDEDIRDATLAGVTAYFLKPLKFDPFKNRIEALFKCIG